ncbi:MAG: hypothetical protein IKY70_08055 [Bacteroidales bacterium]|nr:hypothetical protein [Bacteroidales bacterium]
MKKNLFKVITIAIVSTVISVLGLHLSQNNEYKKFLELNKKALAEEGVPADFGYGSINARCYRGLDNCSFACPHCKEPYTSLYLGDIASFSGNCPSCGRFFN